MTKYRHIINIGLLLTLIGFTIRLIIYIITNSGTPGLRNIISFVFVSALTFMLFKNKNIFTLLLGATLLIGNFTGLTVFESVTTSKFVINLGSIPIPLYWGQRFYSLLLFIYIVVNKNFFVGITTKEYWADFITRTQDLEPVFTVVNSDNKTSETDAKVE